MTFKGLTVEFGREADMPQLILADMNNFSSIKGFI
jgi:hypothetical protein